MKKMFDAVDVLFICMIASAVGGMLVLMLTA